MVISEIKTWGVLIRGITNAPITPKQQSSLRKNGVLMFLRGIDQSHKSLNAPVPHPIIHHIEIDICTFLF